MTITKEQENLVEYITSHGIRQKFICDVTGLSQSKLSRIMNLKAEFSVRELMLICEAIGKTPNDFWSRRIKKED